MALRIAWRALAALLLALPAAPAAARTPLELDTLHQPVPLGDWGDAWMDTRGDTTVEQVDADPSIPWRPTRPDAIYPLTTGRALWFRFTLLPTLDAERWYLEVPYPAVDLVTLYTRDDLGRWSPQSAGDTLAVAAWPVPHRFPLLPVAVSAEMPRHFLVRVENPHSFGAPLDFVSESYHSRSEQATSLVLGIYFGIAALAAALALLGAVSLRDSAYAWYALSVVLMGLTQAGLTGIAGLHLWPRSPWWNDVSALVLPVLGVGSMPFFFAAMVSLAQRSRRLHRLVLLLGLLAPLVALAIMTVEPSHRIRLMVPYIALCGTAGTALVIWAALRGDRVAPWLLLGNTPVLIASFFPLARTWGLIPQGFLSTHAMQVGIAIELPVLLLVLMWRSQQRRELNRRMQGLDRIDPATGLLNVNVFDDHLVRLLGRSRRLRYQSAVLLIDITNAEQTRRQYGQAAAGELPLLVAARLLAGARDIDSVARLSEYRFGMLIEGPISAREAASTGPRLVARCLMPFRGKPADWVARVRVAQALVPQDGGDPREIVQRLEALLAGIPPEDPGAVYALGKTAAAPADQAGPPPAVST